MEVKTLFQSQQKVKIILFLIPLCLLSVNTYSQDQTIGGNLNMGYDAGAEIGKGNIINFLGVQYNTDVMSLFRFNRAINSSDLRVNIGDDFGSANDRFVVGVTDWADNLYKPFFIVHADGKVSIGTEVIRDEKLSVNGTIRAIGIKVENSNWPDYVFLPNYKRMSLYATENFIKQNNHLPGIPSAAEVKAYLSYFGGELVSIVNLFLNQLYKK